jgi:exocyst complex protein 7
MTLLLRASGAAMALLTSLVGMSPASRAFKRLMVFEDLFEELASVGRLPWETDDDRGDEDEEEPHLHIFANHLFHCLLRNLRSKADAYGKLEGVDALSAAGRPHLFLMNNASYMNKAVRGQDGGSPRAQATAQQSDAPISSTLSDAFMERLGGLVDEEAAKFVKAVWAALAEHVKDTSLALEYAKGSSGVLTLESGRLIKTRFTSFNDGLEQIYQHQKHFAVPDAGLRARLRQDAKDVVLPPYTAFFTRFSTVQFSKKHMEQYLRFPPKTVGTMLDELYCG